MFLKSMLLPLTPARGTVSGGDGMPTTYDAQGHPTCSVAPLAGARGGGPDAVGAEESRRDLNSHQ